MFALLPKVPPVLDGRVKYSQSLAYTIGFGAGTRAAIENAPQGEAVLLKGYLGFFSDALSEDDFSDEDYYVPSLAEHTGVGWFAGYRETLDIVEDFDDVEAALETCDLYVY